MFEQRNREKIVKEILDDVLHELDTLGRDVTPELKSESFQMALRGLRERKMSYENDPVMSRLREKLAEKTARFKSLGAEQLAALVQLSESQI